MRKDLSERQSMVAAAATKYMDGKLSFIMFEHGTLCFFKAGSAPDAAFAKAKLEHLGRQHVDFTVRGMKDGNYLVSFGDPIFGLLLKEEVSVLPAGQDTDVQIGTLVKSALHQDISDGVVIYEANSA